MNDRKQRMRIKRFRLTPGETAPLNHFGFTISAISSASRLKDQAAGFEPYMHVTWQGRRSLISSAP